VADGLYFAPALQSQQGCTDPLMQPAGPNGRPAAGSSRAARFPQVAMLQMQLYVSPQPG
jgi:hypothetical protein